MDGFLPRFLRGLGRLLGGCVYRIERHGVDRIPPGGVLLLPNHVTWVDAIILQMACPRPIRFIMDAGIYNNRWLGPIFRALGAIPISPARAKAGISSAADALRAGEVVCLFPEGELSRSGMLLRLRKGFEVIARAAEAPVLPVWLDRLWGSIFSYERGRFFTKWPRQFPYGVTVAFGQPVPHEEADVAAIRGRLLELGEFCYQRRPMLEGHLARACVAGLTRGMGEVAIIDGMDGSQLSRGMLLAAAITLSGELRRWCPGKRIAVVLPPGKGAVVANLAVLLAGKVPVNLNFTAGRAALEAAIRRGDLAHAITAGPMEKRLEGFPWPPNLLRLEKALPPLKKRIVLWRIVAQILPRGLLCSLLRIPDRGDRDEAVLLFTSGSSGEPKGVVLSHRNLLGNVSQFGMMLSLDRGDAILASLPFFHSFGCTVTLWYPLIEGVRLVTYPSPLEVAKNAELIERYKVTLLLATPTFLRGYLRKGTAEQLASLSMVITGAEKLPRDLAEAFEKKFGKPVLEGYGLTETSPVTSVNLPEPAADQPGRSVQPSSRPGSVGKLAPGMAARITDPETDAPRPLTEAGMLWLRGPNIFEGYLHEPEKTAEVIRGGWFRTGDLARLDEDGFLHIEGRLSRFSKIAGEMVPHETVEQSITAALGLAHDGDRQLAIVGVPDAVKGEALILLAAIDLDPSELRAKLAAAGVPNLWIPRTVRRVERIPILGSGKLDLGACKELALQAAE